MIILGYGCSTLPWSGFLGKALVASCPRQRRKDKLVLIAFLCQNENNESMNKADFCKSSGKGAICCLSCWDSLNLRSVSVIDFCMLHFYFSKMQPRIQVLNVHFLKQSSKNFLDQQGRQDKTWGLYSKDIFSFKSLNINASQIHFSPLS